MRKLDCERVVSSMCLHYGVLMVKAELYQILCGLSSTLNALNLIRNNAIVMRELFVYKPQPLPTADTLFDLFETIKFSESGSNIRKTEEATIMLWSDFLQTVEGIDKFTKVIIIVLHYLIISHVGGKGTVQVKDTTFNLSLKDIVMFTTGMPHKPPLGSMPAPSLSFIRSSTFPIANTCKCTQSSNNALFAG